jgi:hypothetical protein
MRNKRGEERKAEPPTAAISNATMHATELLGLKWRALTVASGCQGDQDRMDVSGVLPQDLEDNTDLKMSPTIFTLPIFPLTVAGRLLLEGAGETCR